MDPIRIAIIGLGPRGLTVLERMLEHAHRLPIDVRLQIEAYDDGAAGEGSHRSDQPEHLLINTVASQVTIFAPTSLAGGRGGISLVEWAQARGYRRHGDSFHRHAPHAGRPITQADHLPRRLLGEYLAWAYQRIVDMLPTHVTVIHHRERAADLCPCASGYNVVSANGRQRPADYVFLTTGHGHRQTTDEDRSFTDFAARNVARNPHLAYFASPYPIASLSSIPPAATVAIQGLGLTAHDVVSALTRGRGGRYVEEHGRLHYLRSGREPRMLLFSRNSLPFAARGLNQKGLTGRHEPRFFTAEAIALKRQAVLAATADPRLNFQRDVLPLILREMVYAYRCAEHKQSTCSIEDFEPTPEELHTLTSILWPLTGRSFSSFDAFHSFVHALIEGDLLEAAAGNRSSAVKAATDVLRDTREALRAAVEHGGLTPDSHRFFVQNFNPATNRVAFGPPRWRNAEYLALRWGGLIDIAGGPGARVTADEDSARFGIEASYKDGIQRNDADVLIVARLDAYSPLTDASPLTANLVARGLIRPFRNGDYHPGGLDIDPAMHPIDASGTARHDIWALGYPVEGPHFYTHALPRPHIASRQTSDAQRCVLELFAAVAERSSRQVPRPPSAAAGP
ncbi:MAG: FAD/NAD(P)-binding protein [Xanthomonadaceae bacterium]|nr:FAD/NAD(P)-binding protein [Xanthomonadaceae bacterium]